MEEDPTHPKPKSTLPPRNPETHAAHRRSFFWQVTLPFILFLLVFFGAVAGVSWAAVGGSDQLRRWADVAIIWQLPLPIIFSLICLGTNIGLLYGLVRLIGFLPGTARLLHNYVLLVQVKVNEISDRLVAPILKLSSSQAKLQAGWRAIRRK
jgi:hypothetical protein